MDITPLIPAGRQLIQKYGNGDFVIAEVRHTGSVLVCQQETVSLEIETIADLTLDHLEPLKTAEPSVELLLIGCGQSMAFIENDIRDGLKSWGIGLEAMDTGAACRTFNVLLSEERRVAAVLIAVD
ncbi:MAG: hypothetical protein HOC33_14700 [Alphaproteobacteria bacterium]|jgi:uncharacterized protein|nr:hypothetical protein [Alphaproteobacteria bacterium]MBT4084678.1 hypothetical protein [Alphaproteobacteria bacterium]MBT4545100.1 hypothetical protein [Alphaproteobacteria bacterium]